MDVRDQTLDHQQYLDQLLEYIMHHNMEGVELLLRDIDVEIQYSSDDLDCMFPLLLATMVGDPKIVRLLLLAGSDANQTLEGPSYFLSRLPTALHQAVHNCNLEIVDVLTENYCNLNIRNSDAETALHVAVENGSYNMVEALIERGANVNVCDDRNNNIIHTALASQYWEETIFQLLVESKVNINLLNSRKLTPVKFAALNGNKRAVKILIRAGCDLKFERGFVSPIEAAILTGHYGKVSELLVKHDGQSDESLHIAARYGNTELMKLMLRYRSEQLDDFNCQGDTAVMVACRYKNAGTLHVLLDHDASASKPSVYDVTPLCKATLDNNVTIVRVLVEHGAELDAGPNGNSAAIHKALFCGFHEIATILIQAGCTVNGSALHLIQANKDWNLLPSLYLAGYTEFVLVFARKLVRKPSVMPRDLAVWLSDIVCKPASLQHMCRCSIRHSFRPCLLATIPHIPLPTRLQQYILLNGEHFNPVSEIQELVE